MADLLSPGVLIREFDKQASIPEVSSSFAGFVGAFRWGPIEEVKTITSETQLVSIFGKPDTNTYESFLTASSFLLYGDTLMQVRIAHDSLVETTLTDKISTTISSAVVNIENTAHGLVTGDIVYISGVASSIDDIPASEINGKHTITKVDDDNYTILVTTTATAGVSDTGGTIIEGVGDKCLNATSEKYTGTDLTGEGILIKNDTVYESSYSDGSADVGAWCAKYAGTLGNGLKISVATPGSYSQSLTVSSSGTALTGSGQNFLSKLAVGSYIINSAGTAKKVTAVTDNDNAVLESAFTTNLSAESVTAKWEYYQSFPLAPSTSSYVSARSGSNDEIHVVVVDTTGYFSDGNVNTVLEKYSFLSVASDAKSESNEDNYYKNVINSKSDYIRWLDHIPGGTNFGSEASGTTFTSITKPKTYTLAGGSDGNSTLVDADKQTGYDIFSDKEAYPISFLICGNASASLASYVIAICEDRKDCVAFINPEKSDVLNNSGSEVTDVQSFYTSAGSSTYSFRVDNWKMMYDRYNRVNRWIPLSGDIAGLAAKIDKDYDPWYAFSGIDYGQIRSSVQLAWNPKKVDRDILYPVGINSVFRKANDGTILYGLRTGVTRPSSFRNIAVRRLFIHIEKAIASYAEKILFKHNDAEQRAFFKATVEAYLKTIKSRRGILEYLVVCDETNNTQQIINSESFVADILVTPNKPFDKVYLNFTSIDGISVSFTEQVLGTS